MKILMKKKVLYKLQGIKEENEININDENSNDKKSFIYAKKIILDDKCIIFKLSNETDQVIFSDNIELILSKKDKIVIYIDKNGNKISLLMDEVMINPCRQLQSRIKYMKYIEINSYLKNIKNESS